MSPIGIAITSGIGLLLVSALIDHVLNPFLARRDVEKLLQGKTDQNPRACENPKNGNIITSADYLKIKDEKGNPFELKWNEVEAVHAFKRDFFSTDLICLAFKKLEKDEYIEINEDMVGYHDLIKTLPNRFPEFPLDWYPKVAFPPFEANHKILWQRQPNKPPISKTAPRND
jgi:hypothetical protein